MQYKIEKAVELFAIVWAAEIENIKDVIEQYCYFIDDSYKASQLTSLAHKLFDRYQSGTSALELNKELRSLKVLATGISHQRAIESQLLPDLSALTRDRAKFKGTIPVMKLEIHKEPL
mgnify:FL=1